MMARVLLPAVSHTARMAIAHDRPGIMMLNRPHRSTTNPGKLRPKICAVSGIGWYESELSTPLAKA